MKRQHLLMWLLTLLVVAVIGGRIIMLLDREPEVDVAAARPSAPAAPPSASQVWMRNMLSWYYPAPHSEQFEEGFIRDFFRDERGGVFLDVGAAHFERGSNTYYLEKH